MADLEFILTDKTNEKLREYAKQLDLKLPPKLSREKLVDAVEKGLIKRKIKLENEARAEAMVEAGRKLPLKPGMKPNPSPETIAIDGGLCPLRKRQVEPSPRVLVLFINRENPATEEGPGATLEFNCGEKYHFKLYDGRKHIMPECLVSTKSEDKWISRAQRCVVPVFENRKQPTGDVVSVMVGEKPRFMFQVLGPVADKERAIDGGKFGLILDEEK